ncbi:hypothetical protein M011DRAFT_462029 [Sporormia fimetaria CBS 119925]|uniref:Uncharacterized protein n=1 Tax=Sporormia fimetaria CBS 119925 TaxID=1340428 RepID=A0A6A6UXS0_9PLEO|nr:hypothetical protein M011DRAFT_462029 [Sporormia fimetaria CBS 119925]
MAHGIPADCLQISVIVYASPGEPTVSAAGRMPVTIVTAEHGSRKCLGSLPKSQEQLFSGSCPSESQKSKGIIQGSTSQMDFDSETNPITWSTNGLVYAAMTAYNQHHHLTIRPEDVWFSILAQLSFYINAHAEELRKYFVAHEGKKELIVKVDGTINTVDFGDLAQQMAGLIQGNVKDPELQKWIFPHWSTTTDNDLTVASILMMGSMQKYFAYTVDICCGIPSVTLLGEKADWADMLKRLDKLEELGEEPKKFASLLRPVLQYFVA